MAEYEQRAKSCIVDQEQSMGLFILPPWPLKAPEISLPCPMNKTGIPCRQAEGFAVRAAKHRNRAADDQEQPVEEVC